jgi:hypothetical protein
MFHYYIAKKVLSSSEMVSGYQESLGGIHIRKSSNQTVLKRRHCYIILLSATYEGLQYKGNTMFSCSNNIWFNNSVKNSMLPAKTFMWNGSTVSIAKEIKTLGKCATTLCYMYTAYLVNPLPANVENMVSS